MEITSEVHRLDWKLWKSLEKGEKLRELWGSSRHHEGYELLTKTLSGHSRWQTLLGARVGIIMLN